MRSRRCSEDSKLWVCLLRESYSTDEGGKDGKRKSLIVPGYGDASMLVGMEREDCAPPSSVYINRGSDSETVLDRGTRGVAVQLSEISQQVTTISFPAQSAFSHAR